MLRQPERETIRSGDGLTTRSVYLKCFVIYPFQLGAPVRGCAEGHLQLLAREGRFQFERSGLYHRYIQSIGRLKGRIRVNIDHR